MDFEEVGRMLQNCALLRRRLRFTEKNLEGRLSFLDCLNTVYILTGRTRLTRGFEMGLLNLSHSPQLLDSTGSCHPLPSHL
jgi:hypothetical protein